MFDRDVAAQGRVAMAVSGKVNRGVTVFRVWLGVEVVQGENDDGDFVAVKQRHVGHEFVGEQRDAGGQSETVATGLKFYE